MKFTATAGVIAFGLALASVAAAQTTDEQAAKTEGTAPAAESQPASTDAAPASQEGITVTPGATTLPNGQDIKADHMENGRWYTAEGVPTFKVEADGTVDYATFSGYRRYSAECHVCHGPDGEGSTYAPALKDSVLKIDYYEFQQIVASGKQDVSKAANLVMPAFGTNKNVWCYVDDIYAYLLARGTNEIPRGRPAKKAEKTADFTTQEDSCMNG
ncbi:c-type cytochrome, methanol metabolism-related [Paracoccus aminophilus]|uniref:Cytochrome c-553I n=1 Tax=Paracoccus aminophilus JCM 7686 TaxID=1367847 RepID=S5XQ87_PARAH|nr:c-type cytochrome, methanol metabolism-related [Paracoccus aminophilus]AGT07202.1 cytochrome c-553I [Paracoccus aminophilus JCM 7686]